MRAAASGSLVVCLMCVAIAPALAAPKFDRAHRLDTKLSEHVRIAEQTWSVAASTTDPSMQASAWEHAAVGFAAIDSDDVPAAVKRDAALAAVRAWQNAIASDRSPRSTRPSDDAPRDLPARDQQLVAAIDRYASRAGDPDPDLPGLLVIKGQTYAQANQLALALPIFRDVLARFHTSAAAEPAAELALDAYNRARQYDQLIAFADELAADDAWLRTHAELADTVANIQRVAKRKDAEKLEVAAHASGDLDQWAAVGAAYLDLYNRDPRASDNDEVLYNAGVAFEQGRSIGAAVTAYMSLRHYYPHSKLSARALARLGSVDREIGDYARAADELEEYARRFAGERDAWSAMLDSIYFRRALGDRARALADIDFFVRSFGTKRPHELADAMWMRSELDGADPERAVADLRELLLQRDAAEHRVVVLTRIGHLRWDQSCRNHGDGDGLCEAANEHVARTCGAGTTIALTVVPRDEHLAAEARAAFDAAVKDYEQHATQREPDVEVPAHAAYAQAKLAQADGVLEAELAIAPPTASANVPKLFETWFAQRLHAHEATERAYAAVIETKDAASATVAAERIALADQALAGAIVALPIPREVRAARGGVSAAERTKAYCDAMTEAAEPLQAKATDAFYACLDQGAELAQWAPLRRCERALVQLRPSEIPPARELRGSADGFAPVLDVEPAN